tara:strand:- start:1068 stop:1514 length:447 start_codon:yes stop_codon:yes gene_type:complete
MELISYANIHTIIMRNKKAKVFKELKSSSIKRKGNVITKMFVSKSNGSSSMISGLTIIPPKQAIDLHYHNCEEAVIVLEGKAIAEVDKKKINLTKGDVSWIPPKVPHRFINSSKVNKLKIYWTYTSINANRTDVVTGKTKKIIEEHKK